MIASLTASSPDVLQSPKPSSSAEVVTIHRLARAAFPALDGEGARRVGGRWNAPGTPVVYAAEALSLCVLEALVHTDPDLLPGDLTAFTIEVPRSDYEAARAQSERAPLPEGWARGTALSRRIGQDWAESGSLLLVVPSVIVPSERCVLINPRHRGMESVRVAGSTPFAFDERLLR